MAHVFLSYAREDRERVAPIAEALASEGYDVWMDQAIAPGHSFRSDIEVALTSARCVLVAWSERSIVSNWVIEEADEGLQRGILVPVLIDGVAARIPRGFRSLQAADLTLWAGDRGDKAWLLVLDRVRELCGAGGAGAAPPQRATKPRAVALGLRMAQAPLLIAWSVGLTLFTAVCVLLIANLWEPVADAPVTRRISIAGFGQNDIMSSWIDEFRLTHANTAFETRSASSSDNEPPSLFAGTPQLAQLGQEDLKKLRERSGTQPIGIPVGQRVIAVYLHENNENYCFTLDQLDQMFSATHLRSGGDVRIWGQFGTGGADFKDAPIALVGLRSDSTEYIDFKRLALADGKYKPFQQEADSTTVVQRIAADKYAVGFALAGIDVPSVKVADVARLHGHCEAPTTANAGGDVAYPLTSPLVIYANRPPAAPLDDAAAGFLRFVLSAAGQSLLQDHNLRPLSEAVRKTSLQRLNPG